MSCRAEAGEGSTRAPAIDGQIMPCTNAVKCPQDGDREDVRELHIQFLRREEGGDLRGTPRPKLAPPLRRRIQPSSRP
eukprot:9164664-Prorocentrum_lima.AAC.1